MCAFACSEGLWEFGSSHVFEVPRQKNRPVVSDFESFPRWPWVLVEGRSVGPALALHCWAGLWHCLTSGFGYYWLIKVYQSIYEPATDQVQKCMKISEIIYDAFTA